VATNSTPPATLSMVVTHNPACPVVVGTDPLSHHGNANQDDQLLGLRSGVDDPRDRYEPVTADNMAIAGDVVTYGYIGQLVARTITYSGGSTLNGLPVNSHCGRAFVRRDHSIDRVGAVRSLS
jgi:hypothetical protein